MDINQKTEFEPIMMTLETKKEAETFVRMMEIVESVKHVPNDERDMAIAIDNWFSNEARL